MVESEDLFKKIEEIGDDEEKLFAWAEELAGRPVEVEELSDKTFIVMWMSFDRPPPPKGNTTAIALKNFIAMMLQLREAKDKIFDYEDTEIVKKEILDGIKARGTGFGI